MSLLIYLPTSVFGQNKKAEVQTWKRLQGSWAETIDSQPYFFIKGKYAFYENSSPVRLSIKGDTLKFHFHGFSDKSKIVKLTNDSLILTNQFSILEKYVKSN